MSGVGSQHHRELLSKRARAAPQDGLRDTLERGAITSCELIARGSNYTFIVSIQGEGRQTVRGVYKPRDGENPLWDFPRGSLCLRERAAYLLAEALGWHFIPATVVREGPHGVGSVQAYVEHDPRLHYFLLREGHDLPFQRMSVFDWLANNADRKAGHCLCSPDGRVWGIDHGLTFNAAPKLRTVIWDYAGLPIPGEILADVERLGPRLTKLDGELAELKRLLRPDELVALCDRHASVLARRRFPETHEGGVPWPWL